MCIRDRHTTVFIYVVNVGRVVLNIFLCVFVKVTPLLDGILTSQQHHVTSPPQQRPHTWYGVTDNSKHAVVEKQSITIQDLQVTIFEQELFQRQQRQH